MEQYGAFSGLYDALMEDVDYDRWAGLVIRQIGQYHAAGKPLRLLDLACGTGAVTLRLAKAGYAVTGADISGDMLRLANEKARQAGLRVPFVQMDMRNVAMHRKQDVITCCCDGVNYLTDLADVGDFFTSSHAYLSEDGLLLFDISTEYKLSEVLGCSQMGEDRKECTYLWENVYDPVSRLIEMDLHFFVPEGKSGLWRRFDERHIQRAHRKDELEALAQSCGYEVLSVFDFDTEAEPTEKTERMQFVLRRCNG